VPSSGLRQLGREYRVITIKIPKEATAVRTESRLAGGFELVFETPQGEVRQNLGPDMFFAAKVASRVGRVLAQRKKNGADQ
jgi:hypothetical protein